MVDTKQKTRLAKSIQEKSIFDDPEILKLSHQGSPLNWILDLRPVFLDPETLNDITDIFWDMYEDKLPFQIGGMEVAAIPIVTALLTKAHERGLKTNGFIIRKERKTTGLGKNIEGILNDDPVILVDDLINSGNSLEKSRVIVEDEGGTVAHVFVIVDYKSSRGLDWREHHNIPVSSIFALSDFGLNMESDPEPFSIGYQIAWRFYPGGGFPFHVVPKSTPLLVGDYIYYGTDKAILYCIDRHTGEEVWQFQAKVTHSKGIWSSPAHHDGRIYFGAYNGNAYCVDAETGDEIWHNPMCEFIGSSPLIVPEHNMLYVGLEYQRPRGMGSNAALSLEDGSRIWEVGQKKYQHGSASYYEPMDAVIFGNADHDITAYEAKTGKVIWEHKTERSIKYPPAVDEDLKIVVATSFDGNIYVLDVETGERLAAIQTDDICYTTPLITHGKIFAGSGDRHMYIIDCQTYEILKKMDCNARVYSSPKLLNGNVVFGTNGGRIIELDPESLMVKSYTQLPDSVTNAVSASEDGKFLYATTHMNELYCIERFPQ